MRRRLSYRGAFKIFGYCGPENRSASCPACSVLPCWPAATVIHRIASRLLGIRNMGWAGHLIATMSPPLKFEFDWTLLDLTC